MNKTELISAVAQTAEMTKKDSEKAVKAVIDVISQALVKGDKVQLIGFGTFEVRQPGDPESYQDSGFQEPGLESFQTAERKSKL